MSSTSHQFISDVQSLPSTTTAGIMPVSTKDEATLCNDITQAFPVNLKEVFELTNPVNDVNAALLRFSNERRDAQESYLMFIDKQNQNSESNLMLQNYHSTATQSPLLWKSYENKLSVESTSPSRRWNDNKKDDDNSDLHTVMNLSMTGDRLVYQQSCQTFNVDRRRSWPQMSEECNSEDQRTDNRIFSQVINDVRLNDFLTIPQTLKSQDQERSWNFDPVRDSSGSHILPVDKPDKKDASCQVDCILLDPKPGIPGQEQPIALTKNGPSQNLLSLLVDQNANVTAPGATDGGIKPELYMEERYLVVEPRSKKVEDQRKADSAFPCSHCGKVFCDSRSLHRHLQVHVGAKTYSCPACDKGFMLKGDLTRHIRIHSGERPYKCDICCRRFTLKGNLMQHFRTHAPEKQYACTICSKNYAQKDSLHRHIRAHFGDKPFQCMICNKRFTLKADLSRHILVHSGVKPHTCDSCGRTFALKGNLTQHMRIHIKPKSSDDEMNYQVQAISSSSDPKPGPLHPLSVLKVPVHSHLENTNIATLNSYVPSSSTTQVQSSGLAFCSECSRTFPSPESLQEHVQAIHEQSSHVSKNPYSCQVCHKEFLLKGDLTRHMNSHNGIKPYQCDQCNKMFTLKSNLRQHQTTHVSDKTFPCPLCSKLFGNRRNLSLHLRRHQQASANFTCTRCGRSFLAKSDHFFHNCSKDKEISDKTADSNDSKLDDSPVVSLNSQNEDLLPVTLSSEGSASEVKKEILQSSCNMKELISNPENLPHNDSLLGPFYRHLYFATSHQSVLPGLKGVLHSQAEDNTIPHKVVKES